MSADSEAPQEQARNERLRALTERAQVIGGLLVDADTRAKLGIEQQAVIGAFHSLLSAVAAELDTYVHGIDLERLK